MTRAVVLAFAFIMISGCGQPQLATDEITGIRVDHESRLKTYAELEADAIADVEAAPVGTLARAEAEAALARVRSAAEAERAAVPVVTDGAEAEGLMEDEAAVVGAASTLLAAFGVPVGAGLVGAATPLYAWWRRRREAKEAREQEKKLNTTLIELVGSLDNAKAEHPELADAFAGAGDTIRARISEDSQSLIKARRDFVEAMRSIKEGAQG